MTEPGSANINQPLRVGLIQPTPSGSLGWRLRTGQLIRHIERHLEASVTVLDLQSPVGPTRIVEAIDLLVIDGRIPDPEGHATLVEAPRSIDAQPSLRWLSTVLVALRSAIPVVMHDFDFSAPLPAWVRPFIEAALTGSTRVLVTQGESQRKVGDLVRDLEITHIGHPLAGVVTERPPVRDYWLLDTVLEGRDNGVNLNTVRRCAAEAGVRLVRLQDHPSLTDEGNPDPSVVDMNSLDFEAGLSLLAGASAVVLAGRDLAAAAAALGIPSYPAFDRSSGNWIDPIQDQVADQLLTTTLAGAPAPAKEDFELLIEHTWKSVQASLANPPKSPAAIDTLLDVLPTLLASQAKRLRAEQMSAALHRTESQLVVRRVEEIERALAESRAELKKLRRSVERSRETQDTARQALIDNRRRLRKSDERIRNITETVGLLRGKLNEANVALTQAKKEANVALTQARETKAQLEEVRQAAERWETRASDAESNLHRLKNRRAVRAALAVADAWSRVARR